MAAPVWLLGELARSCERPVFERQLQRSTHVRLELLEARECLDEQLLQPRPAADRIGLEATHRSQASLDDRRDQLAAAREVAIRRGAPNAGSRRDLCHGDEAPVLCQLHRARQQLSVRTPADPVVWSWRGYRRAGRGLSAHCACRARDEPVS